MSGQRNVLRRGLKVERRGDGGLLRRRCRGGGHRGVLHGSRGSDTGSRGAGGGHSGGVEKERLERRGQSGRQGQLLLAVQKEGETDT